MNVSAIFAFVLNDERMPNGEWVALDEYVYTRLK